MEELAESRGKDRGDLITVTLDDGTKQIKEGDYLVSDLKTKLGVDSTRVLAELVNGTLTDLADDKKIEIEGGEVFKTHVRRGGSS